MKENYITFWNSCCRQGLFFRNTINSFTTVAPRKKHKTKLLLARLSLHLRSSQVIEKRRRMKNHSQAHFSTACSSFEDDSFLLSRCDKSVGSSFAQTQLNVKSVAVFAFRLIVIDSIQAFCAECALLSGNYNQPPHSRRSGRPVSSRSSNIRPGWNEMESTGHFLWLPKERTCKLFNQHLLNVASLSCVLWFWYPVFAVHERA